jgi:hypothetical protein
LALVRAGQVPAIQRIEVSKVFVVAAFVLASSLPAFSKPPDSYPVSCDALWSAVKDTLGNPRDYKALGMSDSRLEAAFTVVGELTVTSGKVTLTEQDKGCAMKLTIAQIGSDNSDERGFVNRVKKTLTRAQPAKPAKAPPSRGQG